MKKVILSVALLVAAASASAQWYVGAGLGFSSVPSSTSKTATTINGVTTSVETNDEKSSSFSFSPEVGYSLSDKFCVGLAISMSSDNTDDAQDISDANQVTSFVTKTSEWKVFPYAQYYCKSFGKANVYFQGGPVFMGGTSTSESTEWDVVNSKVITSDISSEAKMSTVGFVILPGVDFKISEKISLYTTLNFLGLAYLSSTIETTDKSASTGDKQVVTDKSSAFGFNFDSADILNVGGITFGAYYNF